MNKPLACVRPRHIVGTDESSAGVVEQRIVEAAGMAFTHQVCRTPTELAAASGEADALLVGLVPVGADLLRARPRLKLVITCSTGFDHIDLAAADELGLLVCNAGDYCADEVADHTLTLLLAAWRSLLPLLAEAQNGGWNFAAAGPLRPLRGATLGLIGVRRIGARVAERARPFGLRVLGYDPFLSDEQLLARGVASSTLDGVLAQADILSLHLPRQKEKRPLLNTESLERLKPGALLINVSRPDLMDLSAVRAALDSGRLGGLALDVWETEPPRVPDPLFSHPRVLITPHVAWYSTHSESALHTRTAEEAVQIPSGHAPRFLVNQPRTPTRLTA